MEKIWHYTFYDALRIQPENPLARLHLANGYYAAGRLDEAHLAYEAAIRLQPVISSVDCSSRLMPLRPPWPWRQSRSARRASRRSPES